MAIRDAAVEVVAEATTPLVRALPAEWSPLHVLACVERDANTLFLESGGPLVESSDWTMLAFDPAWRLELRDRTLHRVAGGRSAAIHGDPLLALATAWPGKAVLDPAPPIPFASGLAGYLSYDLKNWIERFPSKARRELDLPDLSLGFYDVVWAWRRRTGEAWVVSTGLSEADPSHRARRAGERLESQWARVAGRVRGSGEALIPEPEIPKSAPSAAVLRRSVESDFTRDRYLKTVERALEHIAAGDIYQVNLAQRFRVRPAPEFPSLYRSLREVAPAPFLAALTLPEGGIASSSPERFFRIEGNLIETWPIKGTRPRGATPEDDAELAGALRRSAKDRAENVMIVDLERNDLGRVCEIGSVWVPALCEVSSHSNVHHLVSRVEGRLRPDAGPVDVIRALFPGGSITGAPKIRAVEIIDALEPVRRGVYTGAIGYWDVSGNCDWNIAIRTVVAAGGVASFHAGGGIVADSTPEGEYEETLVKASGMMRALGVAWK